MTFTFVAREDICSEEGFMRVLIQIKSVVQGCEKEMNIFIISGLYLTRPQDFCLYSYFIIAIVVFATYSHIFKLRKKKY